MPLEWIDYRDAVRLHFMGQVAYAFGQTLFSLRGGVNARTGERTIVKVSSIVATIGHRHNPGDRHHGYVPPLNNETLFRRDALPLPVLRAALPHGPALARPRHADFAGRTGHLEQRRHGLPALQQPQGVADPRAGQAAADRRAVHAQLRGVHLPEGPARAGRPDGVPARALSPVESLARAVAARCGGAGLVGRSRQATDPGPSPELGKADRCSRQATDPGPSPEPGKADTRRVASGRSGTFPRAWKGRHALGGRSGSTACEAAPERILARARESARRMQPARGGHDHRWRHTGAAERRARFMPQSTLDPVGAACTVQVFRLGGKLAQVPRTPSD